MGETDSKEFASENGLLLKVNSAGRIEWKRIFGSESADNLQCVFSTSDGGFIASGTLEAIFPVTLKLNSTGLVEGCNRFANELFTLQENFNRIYDASGPVASGTVTVCWPRVS